MFMVIILLIPTGIWSNRSGRNAYVARHPSDQPSLGGRLPKRPRPMIATRHGSAAGSPTSRTSVACRQCCAVGKVCRTKRTKPLDRNLSHCVDCDRSLLGLLCTLVSSRCGTSCRPPWNSQITLDRYRLLTSAGAPPPTPEVQCADSGCSVH